MLLLLLLLLLFIVVVALVVEEEKVLFPASNPRPKCATRLDVLSLLVFSSRENDARPPLPSSSSLLLLLLLRMASSEDAKKGRLVPIASLPLPLAAEPEKSVDVKKEEHKDGADQTLFLEDDQSAEENAATARRWERIIVRVFLLPSFVFPKKNFSTTRTSKLLLHEEESNDNSQSFCQKKKKRKRTKKNISACVIFCVLRLFSRFLFLKVTPDARAEREREKEERKRVRDRTRNDGRSRARARTHSQSPPLFFDIYVRVGNVD